MPLNNSLAELRKFLANPVIKKTTPYLGAAALSGGLIFLVIFWTNEPNDLPQENIARQWNSAINQIGIDPVYPPQEDLMVGDVFLVTSDVGSKDDPDGAISALGRKSLKLWRMDLGRELDALYASSFTFPKTRQRVSEGIIWDHEAIDVSIFSRGGQRKHMPVVVFPEMTVARIRESSARSKFGFAGMGAAFGSTGSSDRTTEIRIRGAESYEIPYLVAAGALDKFCSDKVFGVYCTDEGARRALSSVLGKPVYELITDPTDETKETYRIDVEIMIISGVYLTRWIETVDRTEKIFGIDANIAESIENALEEIEAVAIENDSPSQGEEVATSDISKEALKNNLDKIRENISRISAVGPLSGGALSANSRGVSVNETLPRPVAIGFKSVRRILTSSNLQ